MLYDYFRLYNNVGAKDKKLKNTDTKKEAVWFYKLIDCEDKQQKKMMSDSDI